MAVGWQQLASELQQWVEGSTTQQASRPGPAPSNAYTPGSSSVAEALHLMQPVPITPESQPHSGSSTEVPAATTEDQSPVPKRKRVQTADDGLTDTMLLELSQEVTDAKMLSVWSLKVLCLPAHSLEAAKYDHKDNIQQAAYFLVSEWFQKQSSRTDAYRNMLEGLKQAEWNGLASHLQSSVKKSHATYSSPVKRKFAEVCASVLTSEVELSIHCPKA